jgi:hypothetical protein
MMQGLVKTFLNVYPLDCEVGWTVAYVQSQGVEVPIDGGTTKKSCDDYETWKEYNKCT